MDLARKLASYADVAAAPEGCIAEVIGGTLVTFPAPRPRHGRCQRAIGGFIGRPFDDDHDAGGPGGWWILMEVDVEFGPHEVVRPDLAGWRRERLPEPDVQPIRVAPDWVCEVLSPSNEAHDRVTKRRLYAANGVRWYWIVDPIERTLEALELRDGRWVDAGSYDETSIARVPPFEVVELPVGRLFLPR